MRGGRTWLPVHRFWILTFGLLGRYTDRKDKGKLQDEERRVTFGTPVLDFPRTGMELRRTLSRRTNGNTLYGFTGLFHSSFEYEDRSCLTFNPYVTAEIGKSVPEKLPLSKLFWLALGCLPLDDNKCFSLGDAVKEEQDSEDDSGDSADAWIGPYTHRQPSRPKTASVRSRSTDRHQRIAEGSSMDPIVRPRLSAGPNILSFRFSPIPERGGRFGTLPAAFRAEDMQAFGLQEFSLSDDHPDQIALRKVGSVTFVPAASPCVRLSKGDHHGEFRGKCCYLRREDAHQIAYALLTLPWHPESYLIGCNQPTLCRVFLCSAAARFMKIVARMKSNVASLGLGSNERTNYLRLWH